MGKMGHVEGRGRVKNRKAIFTQFKNNRFEINYDEVEALPALPQEMTTGTERSQVRRKLRPLKEGADDRPGHSVHCVETRRHRQAKLGDCAKKK